MTRKSPREIERKLEDLETPPAGKYPLVDDLSVMLGYEWETVDEDENLYRRKDTGSIYRHKDIGELWRDQLTPGDEQRS